jgi:hypothetical protein
MAWSQATVSGPCDELTVYDQHGPFAIAVGLRSFESRIRHRCVDEARRLDV